LGDFFWALGDFCLQKHLITLAADLRLEPMPQISSETCLSYFTLIEKKMYEHPQ
jgi:hypothetical protein